MIEHAELYILICMPGIYLRSMFDMKKRFLNCMNIVQVPTLAQIGATILHIFWCYFLAEHLELQVFGLGLASLITDLSMVIMIELLSLTDPLAKEIQACFDWNSL